MRYRHLSTAALALGVVALTDVLRVFLPSVITIFGQAATTPAELLGAFALGWFVLALAFPPLVRRLGARPVTLAAAVALGGARLALTAAPGGRTQLWLATAGLLAGLLWLAGAAATIGRPVPGLALGIALGAVGHAVLGTYDLVWRGGPVGWAGSVALVAVFLAATAGPARPAEPGGARAWLLAGPALLLTGLVALSPAVAATAASYWRGPGGGLSWPPEPGDIATLPAWAVGIFLLAALGRPPRGRWRLAGPLALVVGAVLFATGDPGLLGPVVVLTAAGTGACLALAGSAPTVVAPPSVAAGLPAAAAPPATARLSAGAPAAPPSAVAPPATVPPAAPSPGRDPRRAARPGLAAVLGMLLFAVAAVGYYAAYDLGYPNAAVPVAVAALVAAVALGGPRGATSAPPRRWVPGIAVAGGLVVLAATGLPAGVPVPSRPGTPPAAVRVVAYNIRMGYGLDGRFDPDGLARVVARERPDVVVLGEMDRGWLLNGGHDTLALLAARLRMPYVFAPAADPLWGDAVLSRFPVAAARSERLAPAGAPTGAQALGVTVDVGGGVRLAVVATHLQPPPGQEPVAQARAVAGFALRYAAGLPLVVAGDLNTEPGAPGYAEFTRVGLVDALAAARPLPTSPADEPREQIDHVLVSAGVRPAGPVAPRSTASDHLPVAVTLALP
ncbi:endonuclease/exonuclease/phosphatase family protein [Micromonospora sp. WMMD956]|uniref:endonuclease/exonuclease/phosphatase family protein n=1 Tax=Micromonospora sp. WMMD956 TaxID=3016108 RepID=UPI002416AF58|nr:endonuclease/exonuclease/phosphatase family protein [Micromonospora sp. WMMD956]MDG4817869.1 endonuclease/exonuclease/phosphatase family protein [Micromonospora sp. WMMD956]